MKIIELRFKNLNSLYGEWTLDFTAPGYAADGIFAITGPTGAGKSTILDAICLALYGSTPRLGKITRSGNEIMSRQTGECYAEVTFESQAGRFRSHWSQHRARKKTDGNLAEARHEIADAESGQILESKKRDVARVIEEKTGMSFDRFTRSMLLAQGGFDTFLKADTDKRAPVLEQITGTEIYSEISKRVHKRQREERDKLGLLQATTSAITLLSDEQETELARDLSIKQHSANGLAAKQQETQKAIAWLTGLVTLRSEIAELIHEAKILAETGEAFQAKREKLHLAQKAAELDGNYASISALREQQEVDRKDLQKNEEQLPRAELILSRAEEALQEAESAIRIARDEQKSAAPLIKKVRALDLQISEKKKAIKAGVRECEKIAARLAGHKDKQGKVVSGQKAALGEQENGRDYLRAHAGDELLVSRLTGIAEQINTLQAAKGEVTVKNEARDKQKEQLKKETKLFEGKEESFFACREEYKTVATKLTASKETLADHLGDRMLREYRADYDNLMREIGLLGEISSLKDKRKRLEDGKPCPLCGSGDHPFVRGNVPELNETEKLKDELAAYIEKSEALESSIRKLEDNAKETVIRAAEAEKQLIQARHEKKGEEKEMQRLEDDFSAATGFFGKLQKTVLKALVPFAISELPDDLTALLSSLQDRHDLWHNRQMLQNKIKEKLADLSADLKTLDGIIKTVQQSFLEKQAATLILQEEKEVMITLHRAYGCKNPDKEETRREDQVEAAVKSAKTAREACVPLGKEVTAIKTRISTLGESLARRNSKLTALEQAFAARCKQVGFPDEQAFVESRLPTDEREGLDRQAKEIDESRVDLASRQKDRKSRLVKDLEQKITEASLGDLQEIAAGCEKSMKKIGGEVGAIKQKIADNKEARAKIQKKETLMEAQKQECGRWDKLHTLIGSADGKKYRNFAQGLTFELMVSHANRQLEKMSDRYLLIRDDHQPLELNVVDNYQAGEIRSTKNLSGGESFIVSLSLALGLSKMASRKVRVDSLFLDEGFGTLDEESLETALETLGGLQQDGKLIGIISHVPALKERIRTQINILPMSGGKSIVSGPGCEGSAGSS